MGTLRKFIRSTKLYKNSKLSLGALSLATILSTACYPSYAGAVGIIRNDGGVMESNGTTHNIYASEVRGSVGMNRFDKFDLEQNNIANMYFHTKNGTAEANNLVNFVNDKININGTVNAIRNNKIGGNLYFLSQRGLVVGKGGVINAGTLNVLTKSKNYASNSELYNDFYDIVNMKEDLDRLNDEGKIEIYGKINTVDGIRLKAGAVIIGDAQSRGITALKSGVVNFADIVNIKNGNTTVLSGLSGEQLKATRADNGDIVLGKNYESKEGFQNGAIQLRAYADTRNAFDKDYNPVATSITGNNVVKAEVQVNEGASISAYSNVDISAETSYGKGLSGLFGTDIASANAMDLLGKAAKAEALVTVNGNVKAGVAAYDGGKASVNIKAKTTNNFVSGAKTNVSKNLLQAGSKKLLDLLFKSETSIADVVYADIEADAIINVGQKADIQALNDININTATKIKSSAGAKQQVEDYYLSDYENKKGDWKEFISKYSGQGGIAINNTTNVSKINVAGKLTAGMVDGEKGAGDVKLEAASDTLHLTNVKVAQKKSDKEGPAGGNGIRIGFAYSDLKNTTDITVSGEVKANDGQIAIDSSGASSITTSVSTNSGDAGSIATTAIDINEVNTASSVNITGKLSADEGIDISSTNETDICTSADISATWNSEAAEAVYGEGSSGEYEGLSNMFEDIGRGEGGKGLGQYAQMLAAGIALNWNDMDVQSTINIGAGAELSVPKDGTYLDANKEKQPAELNISATSSITDMNLQASGSATKGEDSTDEDTKLISAGVLVSNVKNNATVNIAGTDGAKKAPVISAPVVSINAEATNDWDRVNSMVEFVKTQWGLATDVFKDNLEILQLLNTAKDKIIAYQKDNSEENFQAMMGALSDLRKIMTSQTYNNFTKLNKKVFDDTISALTDFLCLSNYANTYVGASAASDSDEEAKFALSGAVAVNNFSNKANVIVGRGAQIEAANGDVDISSKASQNLIHAAGALYEFDLKEEIKNPKKDNVIVDYLHDKLPSMSAFPAMWTGTEAKNLIGGNVIVTNNDSQALTLIAEGAQISGDNISISADNRLVNTNIVLAGGSASSLGITGMGSYDGGSSDSIISVDDEADLDAEEELTLDAKNNNILTAIVGNLSASGNIGIGASLGLENYDINTISAVSDNDSNTLSNENKLAKLLKKKLSDKQKSYLGTAESSIGRGSLSAGEKISVTAKDTGVINTLTVAGIAVGGGASDKQGQGNAGNGGVLDKLNVALAGSVSVNTIDGTTLAGIDGADVNGKGRAKVSVSANEDKYIGAYSGAAAIKTMGASGTDKSAVTLSGSVGVNKGSQSVKSSLKNTKLSSVNSVDNRAVKQGTNVAVGLAYGQTAVSSGKLGVQVVGSGSGIAMKNTVEAEMDQAEISANDAVKNIAQSKDIQVAGGVSASYARNAKVGVGASVAYLDADNTLNAKIKNSKISSNSLENLAVSKTTQVGGAVTAGVMTGDGVKVGVNGAVVINTLTNTNAASITDSTISTENLRVRAYDGNLVEISSNGREVTDTSENTWLKKLKDQGYNVDAVESIDGSDSAKAEGSGNKIISAAVGIGVTPAALEHGVNVSAGVAVGVNKINNSFTATIDNSSLNVNTRTGKVAIEAKSNASLLNIGAVATITLGQSTNVGGGGNVAVNNIKSDVKASLSNTQNFKAAALTVSALDEKTIRNYAGTLNFAGGANNNATLGVSVGVNNLSGDTIANVTNSKLKLTGQTLIDAQSKNKINNVIITAGMSMSGGGIALSGAGTVASNNISGNTKASMQGSDLQQYMNSEALTINADDNTDVESIVGNGVISLSGGNVAGAIGAGADKISFTRSTTAELVGNSEAEKNVIMTQKLAVKANSRQNIASYAVGVGLAASSLGAGSVNGAVSTEKNAAQTMARVENINGTVKDIVVDAQHTNNLKRFNLGAAASGGVYSGSLGFSVGVLNDESATRALFNNNDIVASGDILINAANNSKVTSNVNTAAIAISMGGAIGANVVVDDFTSKVSVEANNKIGNADHEAKSFKATASNTMVEDSQQGAGAGALVAGGIGVGIFTTNTSVTNSMANNEIFAYDITATAEENRNFKNQIVNAGVGVGAITISALLNNVGAALDDRISYVVKQDDSTGKTENATADISAVLGNLDKSMLEQDRYVTDKGTLGALSEAGLSEKDVKNDMHISRGNISSEGVQVISTNNKLAARSRVKLAAHETTNMDEQNYQGSLAGASINIAVSKTKVNNKVGVTVDGTTIDSRYTHPNIEITSTVDGEIKNTGLQGSAAGVGINTVYTGSWINNENKISIRNAATLVGRNLTISAQDALHNTVHTKGYSYGGVAGGALYATAQSKSQNLIEITGSNLYAGMNADNSVFYDAGTLSIKAEKHNKVKATVTAGAVAAASAKGMVATAIDGEENATDETSSVSNVSISGSNLKAGKSITATASKLLDVASKIDSVSVGIGLNANGAISHAYATGAANMLSGDGNSYVSGDKLTLEALVDKQAESEHSISADMAANNGGVVGVSVNEAMTVYNVLANTQANEALYKAKDLTIKANHNVDVFNQAKGVEVGIGIASGTMAAHVTTNAKTHIDAKGAKYSATDEKANSELGDVDISANTLVKENIYAQGDGGGILDISPVAAKIVNKLTTDTVTNISGNWKLSGSFTADALNKDDITQIVKSTKVGVVGGYGGVENYDVTQQNTKVNVGSAGAPATVITTDGVQLYQAGNIVKHKADNTSSGGGLLKGSGSDLATKYDGKATKFTSSVTFDNAQMTSEAADSESKGYTTDVAEASTIKAQSFTEADLQYDNKLNAVGVLYSGVWNKSQHDITYDDSVNVKNNSKLTTTGRRQDITLAAYDNSTVKFNTIANSGGFAASAYGRTYADFVRNAKVNIEKGSILDSAYNTYINAGADLNGISSSLNYTVNSEAYNKSLIPAGTSGRIENSMAQNNQATIAGDVTSVHNVYLNATGGSDKVKQTSKYYTIYTSDQTDEELTTVEPGEIDTKQNTNNYVDVTGSVTAGTHNNLDIDISGGITVTPPKYDKDGKMISEGSISYDGIKVELKKGSDWFDKASVKAGNVEVKNALLESYLKLQNAMTGYDSKSAEYKALETEMRTLFSEMQANGFVVENKNAAGETIAVILDSRYMPSIEVPDIYVSGGNINITADRLQGNGELKARGVEDLKITNSSNSNLIINDVIIEEAGGKVTFNGKNADSSNKFGFEGSITADNSTGKTPTITISSTGDAEASVKNYTNADLTILGKLQNVEGKISISNDYHNINISGDAAISAQQIEIKADQGSVTQNSNGFFTIGGDPISRYQFSTSIANKIQKFVAELIKNNMQSKFTANSYEDYCIFLLRYANYIGLTSSERLEIEAALNNYRKLSNGEIANGIVAGSNVYINARNLNIDGLVQSGYDKYNVEYTDGMQSRINELDRKYSSIANKDALTDSDVLGNPEFLINYKDGKAAGGATYDSAGKKYTYEIKLYYNPATKEVISEKINTNGGKIYLTGAISSTGNGRLLAMNGTADVGIDLSKATGANERDLNVSSIKVNDVEGLISIRDTSANKQTTYVDKGDKVQRTSYDIDARGNISNPKTELVDKNGLAYSPKAGTSISWTGGTTGALTVTTKHYNKKFILWGLIKYSSTEDFIDKVYKDGGKVDSTTTTTADGSALSSGVYIGLSGNNKGFSVDGKQYNTSKSYSSVSEDKIWDTWGKIFGYGTMKYTWKEYEGSSTSSTYTISADKNIGVGFMDGGKGNISIKNAGNLNVAGWLQNSSKTTTNDGVTKTTGVGAINLASNNGDIYAWDGARLSTDNLTANAKGNIFIYGHTALGDEAKVSLGAQTGHISFVSNKGKLELSGAGAAKGIYLLQAAGDVTTAKNADGSYTADKIIGENVTIASDGIVDVRVDTGTDMSSGFLNDGLNIEAQGDIKVYHNENNKDLLVGEIISHNGDVSMETTGSFVDAIDNSTLSDADDRIKHWQELGIISADDSEASKTTSAKEHKEAALADANAKLGYLAKSDEAKVTEYQNAAEGLKAAFDAYRNALKNAKTDEARTAAAEAYNTAKANYFSGRGYSADEQNAIANYAEVNFTTNYGWSADQLLYAIQRDAVNSTPGQTVVSDTANITGHNITLKAGKGIGIDGAAETITKAKLGELDSLKKLSQAKSGDLTWHEDGSVTIAKQQPLLINVLDKELTNADGTKTLVKGSVDFDATNNVYIAGIKDTQLNINGSIDTKGDIKLMADKGITTSDKAVFSGRNLTLYGGAGNVGSQDNMFNISRISGSLNANTDREHGVYIKKNKDAAGENTKLTIEGITTGALVLESETGMDWSQEEGKNRGYIDANTIDLKATKGSDIGTKDVALRILNNDAVINASGTNIYLQGINEAGKIGSLAVTNLFVDKALVFNSDGNIKLAEIQYPGGAVGHGRIAKRTVELNEHVSYSAAEDVTLNSTGGTITQSKYHQILADKLTATAQGDVLLEGGVKASIKRYNELKDVTLGSVSGKIALANGGSEDLHINIITPVDAGMLESVTLRNYARGSANAMTVTGNIAAKGDVKITQEEDELLTVSGAVISTSGDITINGANGVNIGSDLSYATALKANINAADTKLTADAGDVTIIAGKNNLYNAADIKAKGMAILKALDGDVINTGKTISGSGIGIVASGDINFDNSYQQNLIAKADDDMHQGDTWNSISIISTDGSVNLHRDTNIQSKGDVLLKGYNDVTVGVEGSGSKGHISSAEGNVDLVAETGDVKISAVGGVKAAQKVSLKAELGTIYNEGSIEGKSVSLDAYGDINTAEWNEKASDGSTSKILATGTDADDFLEITSRNGSVTLTNDTMLLANNDVRIFADKNLTNNMQQKNNQGGLYTANGDIWLITNTGTLKNNELLLTDNGNIYLQSLQGSIANNGELTAMHGNADIYAWTGSVYNAASIRADNVSLKAAEGLTNSGALTAAVGQIELATTNNITNSGKMNAKTFISMDSAQGDINNNAALTAEDKITLSAEKGSVETAGDIRSGSNVRFTAQNLVSNKSAVNADGSVDFAADRIINVGNISSGADVDLAADTSIDNAGSITAGKALSLTADNGYINSTGKLMAQDNLQLIAQKAISTMGELRSINGLLSLSSVSSSISSNGSLTAAKAIAVSAAENISTAEGEISGENVTIVSSAGNVINHNSIEAKEQLTLDAYNDINNAGALKAAAGSVRLTAQNGNLVNMGSVSAGRNISMRAVLDLTNAKTASESILHAGNNIILRAQNGALLNKANATAVKGEIILNGLTGLTSTGDLNAQEDIAILAAKGAVTSSGKLTSTAGDILLFAQADAMLTAPDIEAKNGMVEIISADGGVQLNQNAMKGTVAAQDVSIIAEKAVESNSDIAASAGNIKLNAGDGLINMGALTTEKGDVYLTTDAGGLTNSGAITSQGNAALDSGISALKNTGAITVGQEIYMRSLSSIANSGELSAKIDVTLDAMNELANSNTITAGGDILFDTMDKITNSGALTAEGDVNLDGFMGVMNKNSVTSKQGGVTLISENSDIMNEAAISAQDDVMLDAGNDLVNSGTLNAQKAVELVAEHALTNRGDITSAADAIEMTAVNSSLLNYGTLNAKDNIILTAEKADIVNSGISNSKNNILLDAATRITNNEATTAEGIVALIAQKKITNNGMLTSKARDIYILTADDITNTADIVAADGDISLSGKAIRQEGKLTAGNDVSLKAEQKLANNGAINVGNDLFLEAGTELNNAGALTAADSISLVAGTSIINDAAMTSEYGDIVVKANSIEQNKAVDAKFGNVKITSLMGSIKLTDNVKALNGSVELIAEGDVIAESVKKALLEISAKKNASLVSNKGSIKADKVSADEIYYTINSDEHKDAGGNDVKSEIHVKQTQVGSALNITGKNVYLYDALRYSADNCLLYRTLFDENAHYGDITLIPLYERYNLLDYADDEDEEAAAIKAE